MRSHEEQVNRLVELIEGFYLAASLLNVCFFRRYRGLAVPGA